MHTIMNLPKISINKINGIIVRTVKTSRFNEMRRNLIYNRPSNGYRFVGESHKSRIKITTPKQFIVDKQPYEPL